MDNHALLSALESLLFVSGEPVSFTRLAKTLHVVEKEVPSLLARLAEKYNGDMENGLMVIQDANTALLATKPVNASFVETLIKSALQENMSKAALEVLAIIAYRAPVSRMEIDAIRGVNCSFTLRNLLLRDLITREGNPGEHRGYLYRPTPRFLQVLGIGRASELPDYETLSQDERLQMVLEGEDQVLPDETGGEKEKTENE